MDKSIIVGMPIPELLEGFRGIVREELLSFKEDSQDPNPLGDFHKPAEICKEFKISKPTFYDWLKKGKFPIYKIGNLTYVKRSEFLKALVKVDLNPIYPK